MDNIQYLTYDTIVSKVIRDFNPTNSGWINDGVEWMGEAIDNIGTIRHLCKQTSTLSIVDCKITLPCSAEVLITITCNGYPITWTDNMQVLTLPVIEEALLGSISGNVVTFNRTAIDVVVHYYEWRTDNKGRLMTVASTVVMDAIAWYIMFKLLLRGMKHPVIDVRFALEMYTKHRDKATNSLLLPAPYEAAHTLNWL